MLVFDRKNTKDNSNEIIKRNFDLVPDDDKNNNIIISGDTDKLIYNIISTKRFIYLFYYFNNKNVNVQIFEIKDKNPKEMTDQDLKVKIQENKQNLNKNVYNNPIKIHKLNKNFGNGVIFCYKKETYVAANNEVIKNYIFCQIINQNGITTSNEISLNFQNILNYSVRNTERILNYDTNLDELNYLNFAFENNNNNNEEGK